MKDNIESFQAKRLEALRAEIQKGFDSGEPTPLNIEEIKARGRKRFTAEHLQSMRGKVL